MHPAKTIGLISAALLGLAVLLAAAYDLALYFGLERRLSAEVRANTRRTFERPAFEVEVDGIFGEMAAPGLAQLLDPDDRPPPGCAELWERAEHPVSVGPDCRAWADRNWPAASVVLAATHARLGSWDIRTLEDQGQVIGGMIRTSQVAALEVLMDLERNDLRSAIRACLETFALSRDAAITGTFVGTNVAYSALVTVENPCTSTMTPIHNRGQVGAAIDLILKGLPPSSAMFHTEALSSAATFDAIHWSPSRLAELPGLLHRMSRDEADAALADEPGSIASRGILDNEPRSLWGPRRPAAGETSAILFLERSQELRHRLEHYVGILRSGPPGAASTPRSSPPAR